MAACFTAFTITAWADYLVPVQTVTDDAGGVNGLRDASDVAVSPDGNHVYVAGFGDNGIAAFGRDGDDGTLSFISFLGHATGVDDGLEEPSHLSFSPDGTSLYVISRSNYTLAVFRRTVSTGALAFVEFHDDHPDTSRPFFDATASAVSPSGNHLIVTFGESRDIAVYGRNPSTGALSLADHLNYGAEDIGFTVLAISPGGNHFYVTDAAFDGIRVYDFDDSSGQASHVETIEDGVGGVDGLDSPLSTAVSPSGSSVYTVSPTDSAVINFERDSGNGRLDFIEVLSNASEGVSGLGGASTVRVSPNGQYVFIASRGEDTVVMFARDPSNGRLTFLQLRSQGSVDGLQNPTDLAISPDSAFVYVSDNRSDAVLVFASSAGPPEFIINVGLIGSWYDPFSDGQGFLIDIFPDSKVMFVAWFTFDTVSPDSSVTADLGDPSQRWLTAQGTYGKKRAVLDLFSSSGGLFNANPPDPTMEPVGTLTIEFENCNSATVTYDITTIGEQGMIPLQRIVTDNVALCELLLELAE